jgi:sugar phosphate permease
MSQAPAFHARRSRARYGALGFFAVLSMVTYLDRVCFGHVSPFLQNEFGLSNSQLGWLFTAFTLSYAAFEVPSGWLGDVFGPKRTLVRIVLWWSLFTALTGAVFPMPSWPALAFVLLLSVRFLFGMGEAGAYPNITRALHNWFPFTDRGRAQGVVWMAGRLGGGLTPFVALALVYRTAVQAAVPAGLVGGLAAAPAASLAAGALAGADVQAEVVHWRHMFWLFGAVGVAWCVIFTWWFRDRPEQHGAVNKEELAYIRGGLEVGPEPSHAGVPWRCILTDTNLWLLCLMYFCGAYGWYFNITWLPKFLRERFGITEQTHGLWTMSLLSGAPLLAGSLACLAGGLLTDALIRRTGNRKWGRRLFGVIGHGVCSLCYFLSMAADSAPTFVLAVALAAFWNDLTMGSAWASCQDIGRQYSGIVSGCMNTVGNLGGAVAGYSTGLILDLWKGDPGRGWAVNFTLFSLVYLVAVVCWLFFDATRPVVPAPPPPPTSLGRTGPVP